MSSTETIAQVDRGFEIDVTLTDPVTDEDLELPFKVDTGNPDAFALPLKYEESFLRKVGAEPRGGVTGGGIMANVYLVNVTKLGSTEVSHTTVCFFSITKNVDYGLMGIDFLNYLVTRIYDEPDAKLMDLETEYI